MTAPLVPGEKAIRRQVKIPESLDRRLRARAVAAGDLKISEVIRAAIETYLSPAQAESDATGLAAPVAGLVDPSDVPAAVESPARLLPGKVLHWPERLPFVQSDEWESRSTISRGGVQVTRDIYSESNCCYCFRETRPDAQKLAMIRTHDGNWWLIAPTAPIRSDEWDRFWLPVGPDCLRNHPEWRFALTKERLPGGSEE
jgi:hypothetical protein